MNKLLLIFAAIILLNSCETENSEKTDITLNVQDESFSLPRNIVTDENAKLDLVSIKLSAPDTIILGEDVESVTRAEKVTSYKISKYEVSYNLWHEVYKWATSTSREDRQYVFENPGSEGAYGNLNSGTKFFNEGGDPKTAGMPVTGINFRDAYVWCNALSELCGLTPVYYNDKNFKNPVRNSTYPEGKAVQNCPLPYGNARDCDINSVTIGGIDNPYIHPSANGFRLPTIAQWEYAARKSPDGTFINGDNVPGDISGPTTSQKEPSLLQQIMGVEFSPKPASKKITEYVWSMGYSNTIKGSSKENGPELTAAGWNDSTNPFNTSDYRTHKQGGKKPSLLGVYDLGGNVYEWLIDWGAPYDWKYDKYVHHEIKGSTFNTSFVYAASCKRRGDPPYIKHGGLRLVQFTN